MKFYNHLELVQVLSIARPVLHVMFYDWVHGHLGPIFYHEPSSGSGESSISAPVPAFWAMSPMTGQPEGRAKNREIGKEPFSPDMESQASYACPFVHVLLVEHCPYTTESLIS